jgi:hypothetical protein
MKQTAVEWIEGYLKRFNDIEDNLRIRQAFANAKRMEKKYYLPKQKDYKIWLGIIIGVFISLIANLVLLTLI